MIRLIYQRHAFQKQASGEQFLHCTNEVVLLLLLLSLLLASLMSSKLLRSYKLVNNGEHFKLIPLDRVTCRSQDGALSLFDELHSSSLPCSCFAQTRLT